MKDKDQATKETYAKLNIDAARLIRKNASGKSQWEEDLKKRMKGIITTGKAETLETPGIKRAIETYHSENVKMKKKAAVENEKARRKMYEAKDKGQ
jgi:hypothetical protein